MNYLKAAWSFVYVLSSFHVAAQLATVPYGPYHLVLLVSTVFNVLILSVAYYGDGK